MLRGTRCTLLLPAPASWLVCAPTSALGEPVCFGRGFVMLGGTMVRISSGATWSCKLPCVAAKAPGRAVQLQLQLQLGVQQGCWEVQQPECVMNLVCCQMHLCWFSPCLQMGHAVMKGIITTAIEQPVVCIPGHS